MKSYLLQSGFSRLCAAILVVTAPLARAQGDDRLVGVWAVDEGFQIVELLFRSDGRYQIDTRSTDPGSFLSTTDRGRYVLNGSLLTLTPYDYFGEPQHLQYDIQIAGNVLTLSTRDEFPLITVYQYKPGSRENVLAQQNVARVLIGTWERDIVFWGNEEYTFRPGGYYIRKDTPEGGNFPPEFIRGRYTLNGSALAFSPYSGTEVTREIDFFGNTLTIIRDDGTFGESAAYEKVAGSEALVRAKAEEAQAFLSRENWPVGVWQLRNAVFDGELTIRPDGYYSATNSIELLRGIVRGRYTHTLEPRQLHFEPFIGQGIYSRDNGDYGKVPRSRVIDYYDGELQLIDPEALSQSVTLARKVAGSEEMVSEKVRQAQLLRSVADWYVGTWEVNDPTGWMEFTFRPDLRYIVKAGSTRTPSEVERGRYVVATNKITLAPYPGQGLSKPRGLYLDLYDGNLFLIGDAFRLVVARKVAGSETEVIDKTNHPEAMLGERGSILGLWTANLPGQPAELVFRPDGQFRLKRCISGSVSWDYGLYSVNMANRSLVYDSRFIPVQTRGLDFYGNTMTIYGGLASPSTYKVNLGTVDAAIAESLNVDAAEAQVDAQWLARVPIGPRDPNAVQTPTGEIPADPTPGRIYPSPTVFNGYHLYRRLIPGFVYFNHLGNIVSVAVTHTREWHFFPTGRVLVRFRNYSAGASYPTTIQTVSDSWGAYRTEPKPNLNDILHIYADNVVFIESDSGEQTELTVEDGRRNLFLVKDYQILSEWAAEQKPVPCTEPAESDPSLLNVGVSLSTTIAPDDTNDTQPVPMQIQITASTSGGITVSGTAGSVGNIVLESTTSLVSPLVWHPVQTNSASPGAFEFLVPKGTNAAAFFRVRRAP